jgi:hypothetical protein
MYPHLEGRLSFKYPDDGLLQIKGITKEAELHQPNVLDENGEKCLIVIKNGQQTWVTISHTTNIESFI